MKKLFLSLMTTIVVLGAAIGLSSCNMVRTVTNRSEFYQKGDTAVMIQTKTTESYDASEKITDKVRLF